MEEISLLEWLNLKLAEPRTQRRLRLGLAPVCGLLGLYWLASGSLFIGLAALAAAFILLGLGLAMSADGPRVPWPTRAPAEASPLPAAPPALEPAAAPAAIPTAVWFQAARLPLVILLAILGQAAWAFQHENWLLGAGFYLFSLAPFIWLLWRGELMDPAPELTAAAEQPLPWRRTLLTTAALAGAYAFWAAGANRFRADGVLLWLVSLGAWLAAVWEGGWPWRAWAERARQVVQTGGLNVRFSLAALGLLAVLAGGAYFRFSQLDAIPPEMTSDHVEKLLDVADLEAGQTKVFFERNTGREPLQFYAAALVDRLLGAGLTHLTLKIVTALAGFLTLPFIYLLGRELEDEMFGLLASLLAGMSFWATAISRVGLRFPLLPLFVAPVLFFLLRGLRRGGRNNFLLAGVCLGAGLYGYSPFRITPVLVVLAVGWWALWPAARGRRQAAAINLLLLAVTALVVFLPLFRYSLDHPDMFWFRTISRLSDSETSLPGSPLVVLLSNQWNAVRMFNWTGDVVWVNTLPGQPALDFISGALLMLGGVYALVRLIRRRDWASGLLLVSVPVLLLPSSLNLAFPNENPSVVRAGGAIPVIFVLAAYPLWLVWRRLPQILPARLGRGLALGGLALLLAAAWQINADQYFRVYPAQYAASAENASEIGRVIDHYAHSIGSYDTAFVRPYPYWVDTRAIGMYAHDFGTDFAIQFADLGRPLGDPRSKLFIVHVSDQETLAELRRLYPEGRLARYASAVAGHDFLMYLVPGTLDLDEKSLPAAPG